MSVNDIELINSKLLEDYSLFQNGLYQAFSIILIVGLTKKNYNLVNNIFLIYSIYVYSRMFYKYFHSCNNDTFNLAIETAHPSSLFANSFKHGSHLKFIEYIGISDERKEEAQIRLCIKSGSANDVAGKEGTAHLLEHINLLFDKLGKYGSRNDLKATGYTDFFNTTYVFDTVDDAIHIYRVFEIINRIIDGWFINQYDINLAKQDIKKEISEIDVNPIVKKIIEGSQLERKDPRNKQVNVDNITIDDIYQYLHKNYEKNNCLILQAVVMMKWQILQEAEFSFE